MDKNSDFQIKPDFLNSYVVKDNNNEDSVLLQDMKSFCNWWDQIWSEPWTNASILIEMSSQTT